jgi:class 3 adenylate cyclase
MNDSSIPFIPFRRKLVLFATLIVLAVAIPALAYAIRLPWKELHREIAVSQGILAAVSEAIPAEDLAVMNAFARATIPETSGITEKKRDYLDWTFTMLLMDGRLLSREEMTGTLSERGISVRDGLDYAEVQRSYAYWEQRFAEEPETLEVFRRNKTYLVDVKRRTGGIGLAMSDIYIMLDSGRRQEFFDRNIAFVLDGYPWYQSAFPGDRYTPDDDSIIRDGALRGQTGFGHNRVSSPETYFLPDFYRDQWGNWFSVWNTTGAEGAYTIFIVDFDADIVRDMMVNIAIAVLLTGGAVALVVALLTRQLSERYSRSPVELSKGIRHVARGDFSYRVPTLLDEFNIVGEEFNEMTVKLHERDRLQSVVEKFLSKELAEQAAKEGMMLGGQVANCTIMFTDFAGFSTLTGRMDPHEIVRELNRYFDVLVPIIKKYGGFPDKYIGDAIVAIFGAPIPLSDHAERAVECAVEMQKAMRKLNDTRRKQGKMVFEMRIGLNTGEVLVGAIGCDMKLEYTSIGESTNLANRMEAGCSIGNILMSSRTYAMLRPDFLERRKIVLHKKKLAVKGYRDDIEAYEIRVSRHTISKNPDSTSFDDFYEYS